MSSANIKEVVKEKYGEAALAGEEWRQFVLRGNRCQRLAAIRLLPISTTPRRQARFPRKPCLLRWAAEIPRRWPN